MATTAYNAAFFKSIENTFLLLKEREGEEYALKFISALMEKTLKAAYESMGAKKHGGAKEFQRCVGERDASVGLKVGFEDNPDGFAYRFYTDPFPGLKGTVEPRKLDATYIRFKIDYLLGLGWTYSTPKHLWEGSPYTEHVLTKK